MILLVRHAMVDACGRFLAGRAPGIHLNEQGRRQAAALGRSLHSSVAAVYCSPLERTRETAEAIAEGGRPLSIVDELNEIDFGAWTGLPFDTLNTRRDWIAFIRHRSTAPIPGGESMRGVQRRASLALERIHQKHGDETVAIVSHGDVLRTLIAAIIGAPLDRLDGFCVDPASVSALEPAPGGLVLASLNDHAYSDSLCAAHA